jgi:hypothetical protein
MVGMKNPLKAVALIAGAAVLSFALSFTIAFVHGSIAMQPAHTPEPTKTLRAAHCFDGTLEKGCPDFNIQPPKEIKTVKTTKNGYLITYVDGSTETWDIR